MISRTSITHEGDDDVRAPTTRPSSRRHIDTIDLRSLAVFAALFYGASVAALSGALLLVWVVASIAGIVARFEEFMRSIGFRGFHVLSPELLLGGVVLAVAFALFLTVMSVLAGAVYNVLARSGHAVQFSIATADAEERVEYKLARGASVVPSPAVTELVPSAFAAVDTDNALRAS